MLRFGIEFTSQNSNCSTYKIEQFLKRVFHKVFGNARYLFNKQTIAIRLKSLPGGQQLISVKIESLVVVNDSGNSSPLSKKYFSETE